MWNSQREQWSWYARRPASSWPYIYIACYSSIIHNIYALIIWNEIRTCTQATRQARQAVQQLLTNNYTKPNVLCSPPAVALFHLAYANPDTIRSTVSLSLFTFLLTPRPFIPHFR
ncbi:hypothetical protein AMATHDRAFT_67498 [Amanita thiersii Skay4041]|uniref:Uncharacterized protein n=1 Tax=Amanita thiersii Skay4041 TaxID=703135 RepID=A0A2A9NH44_9AGAR|nr:hypothetical protein AMATHDRAFT_67498 [Amanita thiersii Skay4041]